MRLYVVSHLNAKATQLATGWDLREDSASDSQPFSTGKINGAHARKRGSVSAGFLLSVEQMSSVKLLSIEGPTNDQKVENLRRRQIKDFIAIMMVSQGVPMICGGDEVRRTQRGNNNPYCQDNEISWFDWSLAEKNREMFRFCQRMIDFRKRNRALRRSEFLQGEQGKPNDRGLIDIV